MADKTLTQPYGNESPSNVIASFDWVDIADGTGMVHLKGAVASTGAILTTEDYYSDDIESIGSTVVPLDFTWTKSVDVDFDLSAFNFQRIIKGTAYINACYLMDYVAGGGGDDFGARLTATIRKWDGSTETDIATVTGAQTEVVGDTIRLELLKMTVPRTSFKKGEILRLNITIEMYQDDNPGGDGMRAVLGNDPQNRDGAQISPSSDDPESITKLNFFCPFEVLE